MKRWNNDKVKKPSPHFLNKIAKLYEVDSEFVAMLFSQVALTKEVEQELVSYLKYIRGQKTNNTLKGRVLKQSTERGIYYGYTKTKWFKAIHWNKGHPGRKNEQ